MEHPEAKAELIIVYLEGGVASVVKKKRARKCDRICKNAVYRRKNTIDYSTEGADGCTFKNNSKPEIKMAKEEYYNNNPPEVVGGAAESVYFFKIM